MTFLARRSRLFTSLKKSIAGVVLALSLVAATPHAALASSDEDIVHFDARVQGYSPDVELKSSSSGGLWILTILMGAICIAVIFKDARRSHLD